MLPVAPSPKVRKDPFVRFKSPKVSLTPLAVSMVPPERVIVALSFT
jgi:hypothetical protein